MRIFILILAAVFLLPLAGCSQTDSNASHSESVPDSSSSESAGSDPSTVPSSIPESSSDPEPEPVLSPEEKLLNELSLEQKVGQLFFLSYRVGPEESLYLNDAGQTLFSKIQPGGFVLFSENIDSVDQTRSLIQAAEATASLPMFISVDQEGGPVQRITATEKIPATVLPSMYSVGLTGDPSLAYEVGSVLGSELTVFGFNMDFAPVCDVFSNPNNTVIGYRAFSRDPSVAGEMSVSAGRGLLDSGIIPVAKHFPGHGDTDGDTHKGTVVLSKTLEDLRETELVPFCSQIDAGVPAIMAAHISLPEITGSDIPATLSKEIITGLLREDLGFDGLIITDSLAMRAVSDLYDSGSAALLALDAGCDMLLMPANPESAYAAVLAAVRSGDLSEKRLDESVLRILRTKTRNGLFSERELTDPSVLGCQEHQDVIEKVRSNQP